MRSLNPPLTESRLGPSRFCVLPFDRLLLDKFARSGRSKNLVNLLDKARLSGSQSEICFADFSEPAPRRFCNAALFIERRQREHERRESRSPEMLDADTACRLGENSGRSVMAEHG